MDTTPPSNGQKLWLHEATANRIRDLIQRDALEPGDRLPSERALSERLGVSRIVVREALKQLKAQGLVEVRRGSGSYVARVSQTHVSDSITRYFETRRAQLVYGDLLEVRRPLEIEIAGHAARRATADDIAALEQAFEHLLASVSDPELFAAYDLAFHVALAAATHNELFRLLLGSLADLQLDLARTTYAHNPEAAVENAVIFHKRILDCVKARDVEGVRAAMDQHLQNAEQMSNSLNSAASGSDPSVLTQAT